MDNRGKLICFAVLVVGLICGGFVGNSISPVTHGESTKILAANGAKIEKTDDGKMVLVLPASNIQTPKLRDGQVKIVLLKKGE